MCERYCECGAHTYTYDANGNAITRNGQTLTWNKFNYPTTINGSGESVNLYYDVNLQRWKQVYTKGGTTETTIYVGGLLQKVTTGSTTDWRHVIQGGDGQTIAIFSRQSTGANLYRFLLEDYQGSVSKITSGTGTVFVSENFTAFGDRRNPATWSGAPPATDLDSINSFTRDGYTGQTALGSMGLNHMNGRVQDAITGRFLSADPHITDPTDPQNYNRYSYVLNNPMSYTDPTGFDDKPKECKEKEGDKQHGGDTQVECKDGGGKDQPEVVIHGDPCDDACQAARNFATMNELNRRDFAKRMETIGIDGIEDVCLLECLIPVGRAAEEVFLALRAQAAAVKGFQAIIREIKSLPDGAKLTKAQLAALSKNLDLILNKSLIEKAARGRIEDVIKVIKTDPRFRFLDQIPGAMERINSALSKFGATLE